MQAARLQPRARIDFAALDRSCLFAVGTWIGQPSAITQAGIEIDGASLDATHHLRTFIDPAGQTDGFRFLLILSCKARSRASSRLRLAISLRNGDVVQAEAALVRQAERWAQEVARHEREIRHLLHAIDRQEAYRLEAVLWPEAADREEVDQLADLGGDVALAIDFCCVPIPHTLLVAASLADPSGRIVSIDLFHGEGDIPFARQLHRYELPADSREDGNAPVGIIIIAEFDEAELLDEDFVLLLASRSAIWTRSLKPRLRLDRGLNVLGVHLQGTTPDLRLLILEQLAEILTRRADPGEPARTLRLLQMQAVADLPDRIDLADRGAQLVFDAAHRAGSAGVVLVGWALIDAALVEDVAALAPGGGQQTMLDRWVRHERDDVCENLLREGRIVANHRVGFVCLAATPVAAGLTHVYARITWRDGLARRARIALEPVRSDPLAAIAPILDVFLPTHPDLKCLLDHHVGPAIQAIWSQRRRGDGAADIRDFGTQPFQPGVSLVIPLYGRIDFIEFQLANFVDDPDMTGNEIIYVLDDPSLFTATLTLCREVGAFYQVPFRLVCAGRRLGFAAASNLGAGLARGRLLLLMNSDVLPTRAGWLADLAAAHQALPDAGAVAPRLIYEDGSTQHEGMRFVRHDPWAGMWVNEHPRKGQPGCGYEAPVEIAALTGACLLLDRSLFASIGGLSEDYIVGDFEDSDLCLRLLAAGRRNWLVPYVVLVHLERQSQELVQGRTNLSLLNCWIHHTRWNADISRRVGV